MGDFAPIVVMMLLPLLLLWLVSALAAAALIRSHAVDDSASQMISMIA
jgi:hypothetical protein